MDYNENKSHEYLSDEDLMKLINGIESGAGLHAPAYLKEQMIAESRNAKMSSKTQLVMYSLKVSAAMAAAIVLLVFMPMATRNVSDAKLNTYRSSAVTDVMGQINKTSSKMCSKIFDLSNMLIFKEEN